ncbi:hypothetical protein AQUCO_07000012v1 [Aquilegia coerulea]|uniref:F-box domain-containing protein n=1 Tax=Aquilegia coerulea TaxID=218851 RepID=A0A2G5CAT5_AQUCA|nr:hypothetical protein AQUCO_07000012v1 [Aquilegia coerulea]
MDLKKKKMVGVDEIERKNVNDGFDQDRISNLPNNLIQYILSFLDTNNAVRTSVLSTRWKYLWTSLPNLDFYDDKLMHSDIKIEDEVIEKDFAKFIERVLLLYDGPYINKFYLKIVKLYDSEKVNDWISNVIMRNVREMVLDISNDVLDGGLFFPRSFFSSETLTVLKISTESVLKIPSSVCFSRLKVLYLGFVYVSCYDPYQEISFSCPVLEELFLEECEWLEIEIVNITAPFLKRLKIKDYPYCHDDRLYHCQINVSTESLVSFKLTSNLPYKYSLSDISSLSNANFDINFNSYGEVINGHVTTALTSISHVKNLTFSSHTIKALSRAQLLQHVTMFTCLIHLRLIVEYDKDTDRGPRFDIGLVVVLLSYLPNIESFLFSNHNRGTEQNWNLPTIPEGSLSCLKSVELKNFSGSTSELSLVKFLLKNSTILEKMTIDFERSLLADPVKKMETTTQLQLLSTGSPGIFRYSRTDELIQEWQRGSSFMTVDC